MSSAPTWHQIKKSKSALSVLSFCLLLAGSVAASILVQQRQLFQKQAAGEKASLTLPFSLTARPGENFNLPIYLNTDGANISGVDVILDFAASKEKIFLVNLLPNLQQTTTLKAFVPLDHNGQLDLTTIIDQANSAGRLEFGALTDDWPTGNLTASFQNNTPQLLATAYFRVNPTLTAPNQATISVAHTPGQVNDSNIAAWQTGVDLLAQANSLTVNISGLPTPTLPPLATATPGAGIPTNTPTPVSGEILSVENIEYSLSGGKEQNRHLKTEILIVDSRGRPVKGVQVSFTIENLNPYQWWRLSTQSNKNGLATYTLNNAPSGCYQTTIDSITASGSSWDNLTPANAFCK